MQHDVILCGTPFESAMKAGALGALDLAPIGARLGVNGIEYRPAYWRDPAEEVPAAAVQVDELGLRRLYATFAELTADDPDELLRDIDVAWRLGASLLRVFPGAGPVDSPAVARVLDHARQADVVLALENLVRPPGSTLAELQAVLDAVDDPVLGTNVDIGNYVKNGQDPIAAIAALAPRIVYCHFKDVADGPDGAQVAPPGEGGLDLDAVLAALAAAGRAVPLGFEYRWDGDPEDAVRVGLDFLRTRGAAR